MICLFHFPSLQPCVDTTFFASMQSFIHTKFEVASMQLHRRKVASMRLFQNCTENSTYCPFSSYPLVKSDSDQTRTNKTFNSRRASADWGLQTSLRPDKIQTKIRAQKSKDVQLTYSTLPGWINRCGDNWHVWNMGLFSSFTFFAATAATGLRESLHERSELCWRSLRPWELGAQKAGDRRPSS